MFFSRLCGKTSILKFKFRTVLYELVINWNAKSAFDTCFVHNINDQVSFVLPSQHTLYINVILILKKGQILSPYIEGPPNAGHVLESEEFIKFVYEHLQLLLSHIKKNSPLEVQ